MSKSFEEVKSELRSDEKILWEQRKLFNKLKGLKRVGFLLVFIVGSSLLLYFVTSTINFDAYLIFQIIILISILPLCFFFVEFINYRKRLKKLDLRTKDLINYEEFTILTNKRWIHKSLFFLKLDTSKYDSNSIVIQKDLAIVNLHDIEVIYATKGYKSEIFYVNFFITWEKEREESILQVILEKTDYLILIEILQKLFSITKEERDIIIRGDCALYVKMIN